MLGLAFFTFYQDTINVSLPKKFELKVALTPTNRYFLNLEKSCDIRVSLNNLHMADTWFSDKYPNF